MDLGNLSKTVLKPKKRLGRGIGSGRGKTSGRGTKGQKARGKIPPELIGGALVLYRKLPMRRGWGRGRRKIPTKFVTLPLSRLRRLQADSIVDLESLISSGILRKSTLRNKGVKILGDGDIAVPLTVKLPLTAKAAEKIIRAGGKVV